jgi:ribosomal protein L21E
MLGGRLSRRNLLILLCQLEKLHQTWMAPKFEGDLDNVHEDNKESYGVMSESGDYFVSEPDGKRILKRFEHLKSKR